MQAKPATVRIKGPRSQIEKITVLKSVPVDLSDIPPSLKWEVPLGITIPRVQFEEEVEPKIVLEVEPTGSNFRVAGVPLKIETSRHYKTNVDKVALYVNCSPKVIENLTPDRVHAYVKLSETQPGTYVREIRVDLPVGVKLVRIVPDRVQIKVE